ncbi:1-phosphatidylinositol 4,5-bisphosphate phosphodiesterase [Eumeta japonica]|uniref:1-phosphatidylinositol 4,5-bisphosphate phosphodiesterase n=1 Tax=Eumeta variegata TaxID=151549 RepID=A0A4C1TBC6_EUMVA|nr:1-phosphatidylinositol 4,5-bisphosphate phosphodiesterase [Eumeta japonica]
MIALPQDSKLNSNLVNKHGENLEDKSLTICSGTDYININYQHVVCPDAATAKDWKEGLRAITHNNKINNVCPTTNLMKQYVCFVVNEFAAFRRIQVRTAFPMRSIWDILSKFFRATRKWRHEYHISLPCRGERALLRPT